MGRVRKKDTKERSDDRGVLKCDRSPPNCKCKGQRHLQYLKCSEGGAITFRMLLFSDWIVHRTVKWCTRTGLILAWRQRDEDQTTRRCPEISIFKREWEGRNEGENTKRTSNMGGIGPVFLCLASSILALAYQRITRQASLDPRSPEPIAKDSQYCHLGGRTMTG